MPDKPREITINEAYDTQDYTHEEMENLVFIEKSAADKLVKALELYADLDGIGDDIGAHSQIAIDALKEYRGEE